MTRALLLLTVLLSAATASAQTRPTAPPAEEPGGVAIRGFADAGTEMFHALDSFQAVFRKNSGTRIGGGLAVTLPLGLFADVRVSRVRMTGERAFLFGGQTYRLGVADTLTVIPLQITGGLRGARRGARAIPYIGAGFGWYRASERAAFSSADEVAERATGGYHLLGGADLRLWRIFGVGGEVEWSQVTNGLSGSGIASSLKDTNLGGVSVRVRLLAGRW